jgi:hypothetical protein
LCLAAFETPFKAHLSLEAPAARLPVLREAQNPRICDYTTPGSHSYRLNSSSSAFVSFKSAGSKPSVNQP